MKLIILVSALLMSSNVWASKARVNSLMGANHIVDTQTVFTSPSHILMLDPHLTFEMGASGAGAEGGLLRELSSGNKLFLYLGHQNSTASDAGNDIRADLGHLSQNNPVEIIYGMGDMAFGGSFSMVDNDLANTKETTLIGKWGMNYDDKGWSYAHLSLIQSSEETGTVNANGTDSAKVMPYLTVGGSYVINDGQRVYGELDYGSAENDIDSGTKVEVDEMNIHVGFENMFHKSGDAEVYYGLELRMDERKASQGAVNADAKSMMLPAYLGVEYKAKDWLTVRASVMQNIIVGSTEAANATKANGIGNNTTVAGGLGLKYNNIVLDGSLAAATTGAVNGTAFLTQASLTYNF